MKFSEAHEDNLVGYTIATHGTWAVRVIRIIGVLPGSPFFWVWGQSADPMNNDIHRFEGFYPEEEVPFLA